MLINETFFDLILDEGDGRARRETLKPPCVRDAGKHSPKIDGALKAMPLKTGLMTATKSIKKLISDQSFWKTAAPTAESE